MLRLHTSRFRWSLLQNVSPEKGPAGSAAASAGEYQKPGALRRELECLVAKPSVQQGGPDLKHTMGAAGRPAHLPSFVHAGIHQLIDGALGP